MAKLFPGLTVIGGTGDNVAAVTRECTTGDVVKIADGLQAHIYQCPCHTKGHILFGINSTLFTGDTLFAGGCGRFFEGNAAQMYENLYTTIAGLPDSTYVFPGHEYTVENLKFGAWVEPDSRAIADKLEWSTERRAGKYPTIPTTLGEEKQINPFLRVHEEAVLSRVQRVLNLSAAGGSATSEGKKEMGIRVLDALRTLKNENAHKKGK
jgi:hydroxyacylglutathione hydrolase